MRYTFKILVLFVLTFSRVSAQTPAASIPDFTFFRLNHKPFTRSDLQAGQKTFFVFFDSDCDHCQHAVTSINKHRVEFKNTAVYLITLDNQEKINHFMSKYGPDLTGKKNVTILQDLKNNFLPKFKPRKYPSMFLFSEQGKLISYEDNEENLFRILKQINALNK